MRILCLHGTGTNSKIFTAQTAALRSILAEHTFEFVEGTILRPPADRLGHELVGKDTECFAYYDPSDAQSVLQAIDDLAQFVETDGPFDGVMGFSQGATLAANLLILNEFPTPFALAIFICGEPPFCPQQLRKGILQLHRVGDDCQSGLIDLPTAHILGIQDEFREASRALVKTCSAKARFVYEHEGGHEIPIKPKETTEKMAKVILDAIAKAELAQ